MKYKHIKTNLENPVFTNLDILLDKSRVKLITFSLLGFFICRYKIDIEKGLSFVGITILDITICDVAFILMCILIYLLFNFVWMSRNRLLEWSIRRTGASRKLINAHNTFSEGEYEYPDDEKQASLYGYWVKSEKRILLLEEKLSNIELNEDNCKGLSDSLKSLKSILYDERIKASLDKFDETFWKKIKGENLRWIIFDYSFPIILSIISIGCLIFKQF